MSSQGSNVDLMNLSLPEGWDFCTDDHGHIYFINHITRTTTWVDPRDKYCKPQTFADCVGDELPIGWQRVYNPEIRLYYYINHNTQTNQIEDPRLQWRRKQEEMLREYLNTAQNSLVTKQEIYNVKNQRLELAKEEYDRLHNAYSNLNTSRNTMFSSTNSLSPKYDPELLRTEVAIAKDRVSNLKRELLQIQTDMHYNQTGVEMLQKINDQLVGEETTNGLGVGHCYDITCAQNIMRELSETQRSLDSGEEQRKKLLELLAKLKEQFQRCPRFSESDLEIDNFPIAAVSNTASQTDLSGESTSMGNRLAEMAKTRLEYDLCRKKLREIQQKLSVLEQKCSPAITDELNNKLLLIKEKDQLLQDMKYMEINRHEYNVKNQKVQQIEKSLLDVSNKENSDKLMIIKEKQLLVQMLYSEMRNMTQLECQLKSLSKSTLSMNSSSNWSISTTSSRGSGSVPSYPDIYGGPQLTFTPNQNINFDDVKRRAEILLKGSDMLSSSSSGDLFDEEYQKKRSLSCVNMSQGSGLGLPIPTTPSSTSTRSVSTAVSNESVAGDSGVFEAANKFNFMLPDDDYPDTAQIQIKLKYSASEEILNIVIEKARNLTALDIMEGSSVYVKGHLLPSDGENYPSSICTKPVSDLKNPIFCECFNLSVLKHKLRTKTLQVKVWKISDSCGEECSASAHVSLADYNNESVIKWYNLLNYNCEPEMAKMTISNREESSDDSTVISSQTSTLTRNLGIEFDVMGPVNSQMMNNNSSDNEDEDDEDDDDDDDDDDDGVEDEEFDGTDVDDDEIEKQIEQCGSRLEQVLEMPEDDNHHLEQKDQETNTEIVLPNKENMCPLNIKRSQTFTPVPKSSYSCKLNRSDSDSVMTMGRRYSTTSSLSFKRNSFERQSLRKPTKCNQTAQSVIKTSLDLLLDQCAQKTRLKFVLDGNEQLRKLCEQLQTAMDTGNKETAAWVNEDPEFNEFVSSLIPKNEQEKSVNKKIKKVERQIYNMRKSKCFIKKEPDQVTFTEKLSFFSKPPVIIPTLPSELSAALESVESSKKESSASTEDEKTEYNVESYGVRV